MKKYLVILISLLAFRAFAADGLKLNSGNGFLLSDQQQYAPLLITGTGPTYVLNVALTGTSGSGSPTVTISSTTPLTLTGMTINSGTNVTTTGTIAAGSAYTQFIFTSGTTVINNITYTGGTQLFPAVVGRSNPAIIYTLTGTGSTISILTAQ